ncbi:MAG: V-type ATP synthase subunit E [Treponema sp.]|nr:V-type ATP synthase subunit E [Treponema sp.]
MEIQVQELIEKIKKDGIDNANLEAQQIKTDAQAEANRILEAAKKEAERLVSSGKEEADRAEKAGNAALQQACRNLVLAFKDEIQTLLNKIVNENVSANYNDDVIKSALPEILKNWAEKGSNDMSVFLPEKDITKLQDYFTKNLKTELCKGVELKPNRKLAHGFQISNKEGSAYYDFSSEAVSELLTSYLNPKLAETLKTALKGM